MTEAVSNENQNAVGGYRMQEAPVIDSITGAFLLDVLRLPEQV
jgi:hypothetical protein